MEWSENSYIEREVVKENDTQFYNYQPLIQIQYQLCKSPMSKPEGGEDLMIKAVHNILE